MVIPYPNEVLNRFLKWFTKEKKLIFLTTFIIGLIANIIVITNDIVSTDSIVLGEVYLGGSWDLSLGRWLLKFIGYLRFALSSSLVSGVLSLIVLSLTNILLLDLFKIKNKIHQILISILITVSPFFTETLLSPYCSFEFTLSFLLSVLTVYILFNKNKFIYLLFSSFLLACSLGLYQAYLGVTCGLCILIPLTYLLRKEITPKEFLKKILKSLLMGILGIIIYEIILHIFLNIYNVTLSTYGGANEIGIDTILNIPHEIKKAFISFYNYFINNELINNIFYKRHIANIVLFIFLLLTIVKLYTNNKKQIILSTLEIIISIILIPISLGILTLIAPDRNIYCLMTAPYILVYLFILALIDNVNGKKIIDKIISWTILIIMIFITISHTVMTNATYMSARITKEKTIFASNKIINDIYNLEEYDINKKVLFIGRPVSNHFKLSNKVYDLSSGIGFFDPQMWEDEILCNRGWNKFIKYYLGIELNEASFEDYEKIITTKEYQEMNSYPNKNYIKVINDIIVVKIL